MMKLSVPTIAVALCICLVPSEADPWPWWSDGDPCGDSWRLMRHNINGVDCAFCLSLAPECGDEPEVFCSKPDVCFCANAPLKDLETGEKLNNPDTCCTDNPCCGGCPDPKPKRCSVATCRTVPSQCSKTICPDMQPPSGYVQIQGKTSSSGTRMCWELRNGSTRKENKIILGRCHKNNDAQKFKLSAVPVDDMLREGVSVMIHPKRDPSKVVVGVREAAEKGWLRVERNNRAIDETQIFTAVDGGLVRLGNEVGVEYLFVTNQGLKANKGDPVMLTTSSRLNKFEKHGDIIVSWEFVQ